MPELIVLLLAAAVVSAIAARWKFAYRDARSVQTYHSALEHLEHIDGGSKGASETHVRVLPGAQLRFPQMSPAGAAPASAVRRKPVAPGKPLTRVPTGLPPRVSLPAEGRKLVFVDESVVRSPAAPEAAGATGGARWAGAAAAETAGSNGAARWAGPAIRTAAVAAAAALVAVLATLSIRSDGPGGSATLHATSSSKAAAGHEPKTVTAGPPASAPAQPVPLAAGSTADSATYQVSAGPVDLTLVAVRRCWVELRTGPSTGPAAGAATFEGTLAPGEVKSFRALPGIWMRIGNPAGLNVIVDGTAIPLPPAAIPFQVTVESAAATPA